KSSSYVRRFKKYFKGWNIRLNTKSVTICAIVIMITTPAALHINHNAKRAILKGILLGGVSISAYIIVLFLVSDKLSQIPQQPNGTKEKNEKNALEAVLPELTPNTFRFLSTLQPIPLL